MARSAAPQPALPDSDSAPSKTRRKRDMEALQALGERLVDLDAQRLATLDLPEVLVDAVALARRTTRHEARRRQMQYIGRLMRDIDPAPLQAAFERWEQGPAEERARFAELERWRTRLLDDPAALDAFMAEHPHSDRAALARQIADAREERAHGGPPHHQRALFRTLKALSK
ncbi:MAG TPA: ribosome biogenesis factor YjgA [Casimicrobiaceae bacterium]|nr:ribosome biogenesis factor YjgA [Casimicrobiaceae bacterium]